MDAWGLSDGVSSAKRGDGYKAYRNLDEWNDGDSTENDSYLKDGLSSDAAELKEPYTAYLEAEGLIDEHIHDFERRLEEGRFTATFPTPLPEDAYCDNWIARTGLNLLADAPDDRPWHLVVNFHDPHEPMDVTEREQAEGAVPAG